MEFRITENDARPKSHRDSVQQEPCRATATTNTKVDATTEQRPHGSWIGTAVHVGVVCLIAVLTWLPRFDGPIDLRFDSGAYYELGAGLAQGAGYRMISEPGKPEGVQYPPALPLLAAAHIWAMDTSDAEIVGAALRRTYFIFTLGLGVLTWVLARRFLPPPWATAASAMVLLHAHTLMLSDLLFAEIPSAVCILLFALLNSRHRIGRSWSREAAVYGIAVVGFFLRTANIALLGVWVVEAFLRREWKRGIMRGLLAALPVVAWQSHVWQVQHSSEYLHPAYAYQRASYHYHNVSYAENMKLIDPFRPEKGNITSTLMIRRFTDNAWQMISLWGGSVTANKGYWYVMFKSMLRSYSASIVLASLSVMALGLLAVVGLTRLSRRGHGSLLLLLGMVTLPVCLTPWNDQFERYIMPVSPIVVLGLLLSLREVLIFGERRYPQKRHLIRGAGWAVLSTLGALQLMAVWFTFATTGQPSTRVGPKPTWFYHDASWERWERAVDWIREHSTEDAIVATTAPQLCHLRTGLLSVMPPMETKTAEVIRLLDSVPVSFVVLDEMKFPATSRLYLQPAMIEHNSDWKLVYAENKTQVYQRVGGATQSGITAGKPPRPNG
jgi:hypothetical protein